MSSVYQRQRLYMYITGLCGIVVICSYLGEVYYEQPTQSSGISDFHVQDLPPKHLACGYSYSSVP